MKTKFVPLFLICLTLSLFTQGQETGQKKTSQNFCSTENQTETPQLNSQPVSYENQILDPCVDYPPLFIRVRRGSQIIAESKENIKEFLLKEGDVISIIIHIRNRAKWDRKSERGVAKNVKLRVNQTNIDNTKYRITANFKGDNTNAVSSYADLVVENPNISLTYTNGSLLGLSLFEKV